MFHQENVGSQQLGYLGLVAATIRELGLIERIDARLTLDAKKGGIVSYGRRVGAMILNGLGFINSRLYMTPHYFEDKPVAHLLGAVTGYQVQASLSTCLKLVKDKKETLGRFILATNQCDSSLLNNHALLQQYKEQSCVESSFKFMKNSAFELDSFFLKTPERITALMMIMTLCYNAPKNSDQKNRLSSFCTV